MKKGISIFLLLSISILFYSPLHAQELNKTFTTKHGFTITLSESWEEVPKETLDIYIEENKKIQSNSVNWDYAYQYTKDDKLLFDHYILVKVYETGRVSKEGFLPFKTTKEELNAQLKKENNTNTEVLEHSFNEDTKSRDIILKINAPVKGNVISVSSFLFTENGHIEIHSYCKETDSDFFLPFYKKVLKNIELDEHIKYKTTFAELLPVGLTKELRLISKNAIGAILGLGLFAIIVHVRRKKQKKG